MFDDDHDDDDHDDDDHNDDDHDDDDHDDDDHNEEPSKFGQLARKIRGGESATARELRSQPPEIVVTRRTNKTGLLGGAPVLRTLVHAVNSGEFVVIVDGQPVGTLRETESCKVKLAEGPHSLVVCLGNRCSSLLAIDLDNGTKARFWCEASTVGITLRESGR